MSDPTAAQSRLSRPIFVGGMSRSGTTVVGKHLLDKHPHISVTRPAEMWFLTNTGGLCDIVDAADSGRVPLRLRVNSVRRGHLTPLPAFRDRMAGFWFARPWWKDGRQMGLGKAVSREQLAQALDRFAADLPGDPREAGRWLAADLIDPTTRARGKRRWVDTTPDSAARADALYRLFPDLTVINMIRDGRDVAVSVAGRGWGTDDPRKALALWGRRMAAAHVALAHVPGRQHITVSLENLLSGDREREYQRILNVLDIADAPAMREFFDTQMTSEAAHVGRWREDLSPREQSRLDADYQRILARLVRAQVQVPTPPPPTVDRKPRG